MQLDKFIFDEGGFVLPKILLLIIMTAMMLGIFVFLYNRGLMVFKSISAATFVGAAKGNGAKFSSCSGYMKRVVTFKETGTYTFVLDAQLSKGDMSVELLDSAKQKILQLNCADRSASITVEQKKKYYLIVHFRSATGSYSLIREQSA